MNGSGCLKAQASNTGAVERYARSQHGVVAGPFRMARRDDGIRGGAGNRAQTSGPSRISFKKKKRNVKSVVTAMNKPSSTKPHRPHNLRRTRSSDMRERLRTRVPRHARLRFLTLSLSTTTFISLEKLSFVVLFSHLLPSPAPTLNVSQDRVAQNRQAMALLEERANKERSTQEMLRGITGKASRAASRHAFPLDLL